MVKKIGKSIISFLCVTTFYLYGSCTVSLSVTDTSGQRVSEVQVGIPFRMVVTVAGDTQNLPTPTISNLDTSFVKNKYVSQGMSMINGVLSTNNQYTYTMVINDEGTYTLGPAQCDIGSEIISSDPLTVTAVHKTSIEVDKKKTAFATLFFNEKEVFCHQAVVCFMRFYYSLDGIRLEAITPLIEKDCIIQPLSQPRSGVETIDGIQYRYLEWKTTVYPNKTGIFTLSPVGMRYIQPQKMQSMGHGLFGNFFDVFGGFEEEKELFSNSAQLVVHPLPAHDSAVQAVGDFHNLRVSSNNTTVTVGEGIVVSMEVEGEGNLFALSHPSLTLPPACTCYEGNVTYDKEKKPYVKIFEYVVQVTTPGTYTIPVQKFTFFDLLTQTYKTLQSDPITIIVQGGSSTAITSLSNLPQVEAEKEVEELTILTHGSYKVTALRYIPWLWFFIIVLLPFIFLIVWAACKGYKKWYEKKSVQRRYEMAFKRARTHLEQARRKKYYGHVYSIFIHMLADRFYMQTAGLHEQMIEEKLEQYLTASQLAQWRLFYVSMSEIAFAYTSQDSDVIFTQAFQWLATLERVL